MPTASATASFAYGIGGSFVIRQLRYVLGWAQILRGDLTGAAARLREVAEESVAAHDVVFAVAASVTLTYTLAYLDEVEDARAVADANLERASDSLESHMGIVYSAFGIVNLAAGNASAA